MSYIKTFFYSFFYLDLRSLALLRVCIGILLLVDLLDRVQDITTMYTDWGVLPRGFLIANSGSWLFSLHLINGTTLIQLLLFFFAGIFAVMLLLGYRTTLATIVSWILLISLQNRNFLLLSGADQVFRMILFWGMFLPWHARYSIDSSLSQKNIIPTHFVSAGTVAFIIQIIIIYVFNALFKTSPVWRTEGTAIYYALSMGAFRTSIGSIFYYNFPFILKPMTYAVFALEAFGSLLLFVPYKKDFFRFLAIISFIGLHIGIGLTMRLGIFPWVCIFAWLTLLPGSFWDILFKKLERPQTTNLTIYYDHNCSFCYRFVKIIKTFLLLPQTKMLNTENNTTIASEMKQHNSWVIVDHKNKHHFQFNGFIAIATASPLLFIFTPLFSIRSINKFGNFLYKQISKHRNNACNIFEKEKQFNTTLSYTSPYLAVIIVFLIIYVLLWNIETVSNNGNFMPKETKPFGFIMGINQTWNMFSPGPSNSSGWIVVKGKLKNGLSYDVLHDIAHISYKKPPLVSESYKTSRWQKYFSNIATKRLNIYAHAYASYVCRDWNRKHTGNFRLEEVTIIFVQELTLPNYNYTNPRQIELATKPCLWTKP